ncbi:MAG: efflux RND transporter periplasmic adaptor subunit [Synergistaceae bacterium]|nr:efflux RND transporter periplasmic adaptor subunit [Synergistaceae bacterium]
MKYKKIFIKLFLSVAFVISGIETAFAWDYIGRAEVSRSVKIRPEINARITKIHFDEGAFVEKSANLFTLDTAEIQAEVSLKKAELSSAQVKLDGAEKYLSRLKATDKRGVSASDIDVAESEVKQAQAAVGEAKAALKIAQVQLNRTKITAPFAGKIGKINFYHGSYVSPEDVLCEISELNPIRILFAMPDKDYLIFKNSQKNFRYELFLADGSLFSGIIEKDFEDNSMDPETGTINIWLKANNENNILLPGALVRVRVTESE